MGKSTVLRDHEVTKKMSGDADPHSKYRSPLSARYGSVIQFHQTEEIFSTWRKLWTWLAKAEKVGYLAYSWRRPHSCQLAISVTDPPWYWSVCQRH